MAPKPKIGKNLKSIRKEKGLTQAEVAKQAGVSVNYYARIERDEVNASLEVFEEIVKVLRVKSSAILNF